ncbi:hypothetical protein [Micromonospora sp. NBC_00821]|uniref:hypothetical protein n=1 Tax=Micromonospora sp. NBC_00821 TaxID=2975977 RepID=UPI002ED3244C
MHLTRPASVQFLRPIFVHVIRVLDWPMDGGWLWIDGYELATNGDAVARRSLFVMPAGPDLAGHARPGGPSLNHPRSRQAQSGESRVTRRPHTTPTCADLR